MTKEYIAVNLNDYIKVKLNDKGKDLYDGRHDHFTKALLEKLDIKKLEVDEEGYSRFQLHEFMEIFGGQFISHTNIPVLDMNVLIQGQPHAN